MSVFDAAAVSGEALSMTGNERAGVIHADLPLGDQDGYVLTA
jgi:hypothetical protein